MPNLNMRLARDGRVGGCLTCYFKLFLYLLIWGFILAMFAVAIFLFLNTYHPRVSLCSLATPWQAIL